MVTASKLENVTLRLWKFSNLCSRHTVGVADDDIMFHILVSLIIEIWNCFKKEVVFFPVFPTSSVQNLFFPGWYLPVNTTVKTKYRPKPSNPGRVSLHWDSSPRRCDCLSQPSSTQPAAPQEYSSGEADRVWPSVYHSCNAVYMFITAGKLSWLPGTDSFFPLEVEETGKNMKKFENGWIGKISNMLYWKCSVLLFKYIVG